MASAKAWALRCQLEAQQHPSAAFSTLTYSDDALPPTLDKKHLQLWIKRFRKQLGTARPLRFFACGEYGEKNGRPHYHAILFGASERDRDLIDSTWGLGRTHTVRATPASIHYVAGYTSKKINWRREAAAEHVDPRSGEVYEHQPPFLQMSRRPGIGGHARDFTNSWRLFAVHNGQSMPVPRFLHEAWKNTATPLEKEELLFEKSQLAKSEVTQERLNAAEAIAQSKQSLLADRRPL